MFIIDEDLLEEGTQLIHVSADKKMRRYPQLFWHN